MNGDKRRGRSDSGRTREQMKKKGKDRRTYLDRKANPKRKGDRNGNLDKAGKREAEAVGNFASSGLSADGFPIPVNVSIEREEQLMVVLSNPSVSTVFIDAAAFSDDALPLLLAQVHHAGKKAGLRLPRVLREIQSGKPLEDLIYLLLDSQESKPDALLIRSFDEVELLLQMELKERPEIVFDYTLYGYHHAAADVLCSLGQDKLTFPIELTFPELLHLCRRDDGTASAYKYELLVYGHLPMMVSANCLRKTTDACDHENRILRLKDRMEKSMPVRCYCKPCYNEIYNADPLVLYDLPEEIQRLSPASVRYDFSIESASLVRQILSGQIPASFTRGHFKNGIQ